MIPPGARYVSHWEISEDPAWFRREIPEGLSAVLPLGAFVGGLAAGIFRGLPMRELIQAGGSLAGKDSRTDSSIFASATSSSG
jgi:hypothetical protein